MHEDFDRIDQDGHNPTTYGSFAEMVAAESIPFDNPDREDGCWNCRKYNGEACMKCWKHGDMIHYVPERDDREPDDWCEDWKEDKHAKWEVHHGNDP